MKPIIPATDNLVKPKIESPRKSTAESSVKLNKSPSGSPAKLNKMENVLS